MARATWKGAVLAEAPSDSVQTVDGYMYFPEGAVQREYLRSSETHTTCPWKGQASYYDVVVDGQVNRDAAWHYPQPSEAAQRIADHIAFWRGVQVEL
jgi:uncharacterized protein (DUF427 family)